MFRGIAGSGADHTGAGTSWRTLALLALSLGIATAANAASLTLGDAAVGVGSTTDLTISVDNADGIEAASLRITYDPAVVRVASAVHVTTLTSGCMLVSNTLEPGLVQIGLACMQPLSGSGPMLVVQLLGRGVGSSDLAISNCNINEGGMACVPKSGVATVQTAVEPPAEPAAAAIDDLAFTDDLAQ